MTRCRLALTLGLLGSLLAGGRADGRAQAPPPLASPQAVQTARVTLGPASTSAEVPFTVDLAGEVEIEVVAPVAAFVVELQGPDGEVFDSQATSQRGGHVLNFATRDEAAADATRVRHVMRMPGLEPGVYTVRVRAEGEMADSTEFVVSVRSNSPVEAALTVAQPELRLGDEMVLTARVVDGDRPLSGAAITVLVTGEDSPPESLTLFDEGHDGRGQVGDGIYSAAFIPSLAGAHTAIATITGLTPDGFAFERTASAAFTVRATFNEFDLSADSGTAVDQNGDGIFERLVFKVSARLPAPGRYLAFVRLQTASGQALIERAEFEGAQGWQEILVVFAADVLQRNGEDGPYAISSVELASLGGSPAYSSRIGDLGQTLPYRLREFEGFQVSRR